MRPTKHIRRFNLLCEESVNSTWWLEVVMRAGVRHAWLDVRYNQHGSIRADGTWHPPVELSLSHPRVRQLWVRLQLMPDDAELWHTVSGVQMTARRLSGVWRAVCEAERGAA